MSRRGQRRQEEVTADAQALDTPPPSPPARARASVAFPPLRDVLDNVSTLLACSSSVSGLASMRWHPLVVSVSLLPPERWLHPADARHMGPAPAHARCQVERRAEEASALGSVFVFA